MANIFRREQSPAVWLRYKAADGKWKAKSTGYLWSNLGDVRQAKLLARRQSEIEASRPDARDRGMRFDEWVLSWMIQKYGDAQTSTPDVYKRMWRTVMKFLDASDIPTAALIKREHGGKYLEWRTKSAGRNSAIGELKLLSMVVEEAKNRGYCSDNPLRRLGLKKEKPAEKLIWSDDDIRKAAAHFEREKSHWMLVAFYFGLYQAARLRQSQLPLQAIHLEAGVISYPDNLVKGGEGFTQPIDSRFLPRLRQLMEASEGKTLCVVPWDASIRLRRSLDRAGLPGLCHHGLRATWITRAAGAGVPESQAMAFCHHESREVHRVYKKLSSIGLAHVPALISLPILSGVDVPATTPGSGEG